ncbi:MAG: Bro-N domain-containing protein [Kovacikia sp.]
MSNLSTFAFEGHEVRFVGTPGKPEWVAQDVAVILEIQNFRQNLASFDEDEKGVCNVYTPGGNQELLTVSEPGLYRLIFKSRKEVAKRFQRWIFHEVLPAIRKNGIYSVSAQTEAAPPQPLPTSFIPIPSDNPPTDQAILRSMLDVKGSHPFIRWRGSVICSTQQVADWLGVPRKRIQSYYQRRREEFAEYGVVTRKPTSSMRPKMGLHSTANVVNLFTPRALLQIAELFGSDSETGSKLVALIREGGRKSKGQNDPLILIEAASAKTEANLENVVEMATLSLAPEPEPNLPGLGMEASNVKAETAQTIPTDPRIQTLNVLKDAATTAKQIEQLEDPRIKDLLNVQLTKTLTLISFKDMLEMSELEARMCGNSSGAKSAPIQITISDRVKALGKKLSPYQTQQAGLHAARLYRDRYHTNPPKQSTQFNGVPAYVNVYSGSDLELVDGAIQMAERE